MEEVWKDIPGYEGRYQASTEGRIRSLDQEVKRGKGTLKIRGRVLKKTLDAAGYPTVSLGYKKPKIRTHILIALTFFRPST